MSDKIETVQVAGAHLEVSWTGNGQLSRYPAVWLRDHCHAARSMNRSSHQRSVDTFSIPETLAPAAVRMDAETVFVTWPDEAEESVYPVSFLQDMAEPGLWTEDRPKSLWMAADIEETLPEVPHAAVMKEDGDGLAEWLEQVDRHGFALVTGVPATPEATEEMLKRVGYIRQTIFGGFWDFTANKAFADTAYSTVEIGPHTDGTYAIDSPGYQAFHCLEFDGTGGESIFVDAFKVAEVIREQDPEAFEVLASVPVPAQYKGDGVHLMAENPVIGLDRDGGLRKITYNNYDRAPFRLEDSRQAAFYRSLGLFNRLINDPAYQLRFGLRPGTVVLFDNWRVLHAREAYEGHRRLCGAYHNKEDVLSKLRLLRNRG
ncbi:trimethyllysine dioxygenase [Leisingera thetidis]|uniref:trimethyllysine dioxygenase n=1 Tax=Leisingera thetidis TaxID=2930199 RepID=UPI0021F77BE9|nr:trimethyllysine dioxygenase [Leisingera thetidis]